MISLAAVVLAATFTRTMDRVASMDPAMATSIYDSHAVQLVYEPPLDVDYEARPYRLVPGFCELPTVSADGLTYVFKVKVNSGRPVLVLKRKGFRFSALRTWCGRWSGSGIRRFFRRTDGF